MTQGAALITANRHRVVTRVALLLAATATLYGFSLAVRKAPCWALFFAVAVIAWPIWCYQIEHTLFERRAILSEVTHEASRLRRLLWKGQVSRVLQTFVAIFWATLLLVFASLLGPWQWLVVVADAVILALLIGPITKRLAPEVRAEQSGRAARRWPLALINIAILSLAFFAIDFYFVGAPDSRGLAWNEVAEKAFQAVYGNAACSVVGVLVGGLAALNALAWHAAQILIPSLPNPGLKWAAWSVFLLQAGVIAIALTRLHLGFVTLLDRQGVLPEAPAESSRAFLVTMTLVFMLCAAIALVMRDFDASALASRGRQAVAWANPCRSDPNAIVALKKSVDSQLQNVRSQENKRTSNSANAAVDALFQQAEKGVDNYLDWYFSVVGEYQRLGAMVAGNFADTMHQEQESRVFGKGFIVRLEQQSHVIAAESQERIFRAAVELGTQVKTGVESKPCLLGQINLVALGNVKRDALRASTAAVSGGVVGIAAGMLARKAATTSLKNAASKQIFKGAASIAGRTVTKRTGTMLIAAVSGAAVCGPFAPLCAFLAAGATWIGLDKAFIEIDELRFRNEMRKELLETIQSQKAVLASEMHSLHRNAINKAVSGVEQSLKHAFVPVREGL